MQRARSPRILIGLAAATLCLAACAGSSGASSPPAPASGDLAARSFGAIPVPRASTGSSEGMPQDMVSAVIAEAASDLQVDANSFEIIAAESVTWNDGSLGCPEPGMSYTQALVPGYRVVLGIGPERYAYHSDRSGEFRYCENPRPPLESNPND